MGYLAKNKKNYLVNLQQLQFKKLEVEKYNSLTINKLAIKNTSWQSK